MSPGAAAILGWAGAFRGDEHWVVGVGVGVEQVFDHDLVLPVIAEVVGVADSVADAADQLAEVDAALVGVAEFGIGQSELLRPAGEHVLVQAYFLLELIAEAFQKSLIYFLDDTWRQDFHEFNFILDAKLPAKMAAGEKS